MTTGAYGINLSNEKSADRDVQVDFTLHQHDDEEWNKQGRQRPRNGQSRQGKTSEHGWEHGMRPPGEMSNKWDADHTNPRSASEVGVALQLTMK